MSEILGFREQLKENQYVPVGVDLGYSDYETAAKSFQEFMHLPEHIRSAANYTLDSRRNTTFGVFQRKVGAINSEGRGLDQDNKDVFHYGVASAEVMRYRLSGNLPKEAAEFLKVAEEIYQNSTLAMRSALKELDRHEVGLVGLHFSNIHPDNHHVRFVAYRHREGEILATPHKDRSVATIALAENRPGLWIERNNLKNYLEPRKNGEGLFFLGAGWEELPKLYRSGNEEMVPAYHGVDQITDASENGIMRWAIILFANPYELDTVPAPEKTRPYKALGQKIFQLPDAKPAQELLSQKVLARC